MKIIFLAFKLNYFTGGGSTQELDAKMRAFLECGHAVSVITLFSEQNKLLPDLPYPVIEKFVPRADLWTIQRAVAQTLREYQAEADVFHLEGHFGYGGGWYQKHGGKTPVVIHFNIPLSFFPESTRQQIPETVSLKKKLRRWFERRICFPIMNHATLFTFTSPVLRSVYVGYGVDEKKTMIVPDFFDSREIIGRFADQERLIADRGEIRTPWTLLCGGRMITEKGFDIAIRAFAALPHPEQFHLIVTGDGPEKDRLVSLARELGVDHFVSFPGWVEKEEQYRLFQQADIFIIPRWRPELTSMLTLEAFAFGLPLIVTSDTALAWQAGGGALAFPDEDHGTLAERIDHIASDPSLRVQLARAGADRLKELDYRAHVGLLDKAMSLLHTYGK